MSHSRSQSPKNKFKIENEIDKNENKLTDKNELKLQLQTISNRLAEIQLEKRKLSPLYHPSKSSPKKIKKSTKREFYHPKLEFVMAEAAYSPYLTPPTASYGQKTLHYPEKMKEIRFQGRDPIPEEGFPVEIEFARRRFIKDIIKFKPRFEFHEEKTNLPLQYLQPPPDLYIPNVHAKPRRESMVFPNLYQPLKGHRGKIPAHLRAYLDFDPLRPETAPAKKLTNEEAKELIHELTEARTPSPIRRMGSGSYQAHAARGGPNKYREDMKYRKAVKEFVRMLSNASGHGELSPNGGTYDEFDFGDDEEQENNDNCDNDEDDEMANYFKEDLNENDSQESKSPRLSSIQKESKESKIEEKKKKKVKIKENKEGKEKKGVKSKEIIEEKEKEEEELVSSSNKSEKVLPPFPIFENATLRIKKIQIKNLQSKLVFGTKDVYVSIKSGKIYSCQTNELFNPPNPAIWEFLLGDNRMIIPVTPSSIEKLKLKITVYNKSKVKQRADIIYGTHTINISEQLRHSGFNNDITLTFEIKTNDGIKGGKMTIITELLDGIFENNEPDQESNIEHDIIVKDKGKGKLTQELENISPTLEISSPRNDDQSQSKYQINMNNEDDNNDINDANDNNDVNDNESKKNTKEIKSSEVSLTDENYVPLSIDNFFDALSSDDEATNIEICYYNEGSLVSPTKTAQLNDEDNNENNNEYDDDKLYDGFDDDEDFTNDNNENINDNNNNNSNNKSDIPENNNEDDYYDNDEEFQDQDAEKEKIETENLTQIHIQSHDTDENEKDDKYEDNIIESKKLDKQEVDHPLFKIGRQLTLTESNENWEHENYDNNYEDFENEESKIINEKNHQNETKELLQNEVSHDIENNDNSNDNQYEYDGDNYGDDNHNNNIENNEHKNPDENSHLGPFESKITDDNNDNYGGDEFDEESQTKNSIEIDNKPTEIEQNNDKQEMNNKNDNNNNNTEEEYENEYENENYDDQSQVTKNENHTIQNNINNENSVFEDNNDDYNGDDFDNESLTKQSLHEKTSQEDYGDEYDSESIEKNQNSNENHSLEKENEGSVAYGTDDFENESETKLENNNEDNEYGEEFESESVLKVDQQEEHETSEYYDLSADDHGNHNNGMEESNLHGMNVIHPND